MKTHYLVYALVLLHVFCAVYNTMYEFMFFYSFTLFTFFITIIVFKFLHSGLSVYIICFYVNGEDGNVLKSYCTTRVRYTLLTEDRSPFSRLLHLRGKVSVAKVYGKSIMLLFGL